MRYGRYIWLCDEFVVQKIVEKMTSIVRAKLTLYFISHEDVFTFLKKPYRPSWDHRCFVNFSYGDEVFLLFFFAVLRYSEPLNAPLFLPC